MSSNTLLVRQLFIEDSLEKYKHELELGLIRELFIDRTGCSSDYMLIIYAKRILKEISVMSLPLWEPVVLGPVDSKECGLISRLYRASIRTTGKSFQEYARYIAPTTGQRI